MIGIILTVLGTISFIFASTFWALYYIFEYRKELIGKITGSLITSTHKKNVPVYGANRPGGHIRLLRVIKYLSKGTYEYNVNGKAFRIKHSEESKHAPKLISVVYLKRFPYIASAESETGLPAWIFHALISSAISICSIFGGLSILFML